MYGWEIADIILNLPINSMNFAGTYCINDLNYLQLWLKEDSVAVVNTDPLDQPGSHWFTVNRLGKENHFEIFDPLGFPSYKTQLVAFFAINSFIYNNYPVQASWSGSCGLFCAIYTIYKLYNAEVSLNDLLCILFDKVNLLFNETFVREFVQSL